MKSLSLSEENRIKCDKEIAYFLGWRVDNSFPDKGRVWRLGNNVELDTTFKFLSDYEVLMSVVEKIENSGFVFNIKKSQVIITSIYNTSVLGNYVELDSPSCTDKRVAIYLAVAEFCRLDFQSKSMDFRIDPSNTGKFSK